MKRGCTIYKVSFVVKCIYRVHLRVVMVQKVSFAAEKRVASLVVSSGTKVFSVMKIKGDIILCLLFSLLLSEVACGDSSFTERRFITQRNVRDMTRGIDRFGSLERTRLKSYRVLHMRKLPSTGNSRMHVNEEGLAIKQARHNLKSFNLNRMDLTREIPNTRGMSYLRFDNRLVDERQRALSTKLKNVIENTQLSTIDITFGKNSNRVARLTRSYNINDRRMTKKVENRFSLQIRENRLREHVSSKRSIITNESKSERKVSAMRVRNKDTTNSPDISVNDLSDTIKSLSSSRRDVGKPLIRNTNRKNGILQRSEKLEIIRIKSRYNSRNSPTSSFFEVFPERNLHRKQSEMRSKQISLTSRRELKIPENGGRISSEDSRQLRRNVRIAVVRDKNSGETLMNRRNGRGFRGRQEKRNAMDERRENVVRIKVPFMNKNRELSYRRLENLQGMEMKSQRYSVYSITKVSGRRHFSRTQRENSLSNMKHNRVLRETRDFGRTIGQKGELLIGRETRTIQNRARSAVFSRVRRFTLRMTNSGMGRNALNKETISSPGNIQTVRHTYIIETSQQEVRLSRSLKQIPAVQNRERRTLRTRRESSVRGINRFVKNLDQTSANSALLIQFSMQRVASRIAESRQKRKNNIVRDRNVVTRRQLITERLNAQPQSAISQIRNFRNVVPVSKSYGIIKSNISEELCTAKNSKIKDLFTNLSFTKNSYRLFAPQRRDHHVLINLPILKHYNEARWSLYEYFLQKQSCMLSFALNVILGLCVIVAMSEDINKDFTSRLKNRVRDSIFKYLQV